MPPRALKKSPDPVLARILALNAGRDPQRLALKLAKLRENPYAFFRGTAPLFYDALGQRHPALQSPLALVCGDLHLENFGSYKGDNRLVYFDINDFDEACRAPVGLDLLRLLSSWQVYAAEMKLSAARTRQAALHTADAYRAALAEGKPRWIERATATGAIRALLKALRQRSRKRLLKRYLRRSGTRWQLDTTSGRALAAAPGDRRVVRHALAGLHAPADIPGLFHVSDVARRVAGNASLGLPRYIVLTHGRESAFQQFLLDLKFAPPSCLPGVLALRQPVWRNDAERVVTLQSILQAVPMASIDTLRVGRAAFVLKELQPSADRINLADLGGNWQDHLSLLEQLARLSAWAHLRGAGRLGTATADELQHYAQRPRLSSLMVSAARELAATNASQWRSYVRDSGAAPGR